MSTWFVRSIGILAVLLTCTALFATPYIPEEILDQQYEERLQTQPDGPQVPPTPFPERSLFDELDEYENDWLQLLDWQMGMQVSDIGANFGGQREGEQDWNIIQTDNTQEVLRDWARYGFLTGDTATYSEYIRNAWQYCEEWPAWEEEGGGNPNYYRVHNSGWGCVAAMEYYRAYGDTTWLWYGDACAEYLDTYRLTVNVTTTGTNPLSAGFGAGALYLYGSWRENQDWMDAAQEIAEDVQAWIEYNPDRLNNAESWAMSGGTAMWGVVTALYTDDHEAGAEWIPQYTEYMDLYSGPGTWNNSWTVWYAHAWNAIHRVLDDAESLENVIWITDWLLLQDEPDDDGGIPGTEDQYNNDQSWTSAYLAWYTLELLLDVRPDAQALNVTHPGVDSLLTGQPTTLYATIRNGGMEPLDGALVSVQIGNYAGFALMDLPPLTHTTASLAPIWIPDEIGETDILLTVTHASDTVSFNDSLAITQDVYPAAFVNGYITSGEDESPVQATVLLYNDPEMGGLHQAARTDSTGLYSIRLANCEEHIPFDLEVYPEESRFAAQQSLNHTSMPLGQERVDIALDTASVLLVQEGDGNIYDSPMCETLFYLGEAFHPWAPWSERGYPDEEMLSFPVTIWSCGTYETDILPGEARVAVGDYFDAGGSLLLHGSGIQNLWGGFYFLRNSFGVDADSMDIGRDGLNYRMTTSGSYEILDAGFASVEGESIDETVPVNGGMGVMELDSSGMYTAVAFESADHLYRTILAGFDVDRMFDYHGTELPVERSTFIEDVLTWLRWEVGVFDDDPDGTTSLPSAFSLNAYPNPFNPSLQVEIALPEQGVLKVDVFDVLGRLVCSWHPGQLQAGNYSWSWDASASSSGVYFIRAAAGRQTATQRVLLLR